MAFEESVKSLSFLADSTLAVATGVPGVNTTSANNVGYLYRFVKFTGTKTVGLVTSSADTFCGVLQNKPQVTNMAATVGFHGVSNVISGAGSGANAITAGDPVTSDNAGRAIKNATLSSAVNLATSSTFAISSGVVTVTSSTHSLAVGDTVVIAATGNTNAANNGTFVVQSVPSTTTFTINNSNGSAEAATGGTVTKVTQKGKTYGIAIQSSTTAGELIPVLLKV